MFYALAVLGGVPLLVFLKSYTAKNYLDQNYPFYSGNYAIEDPYPAETLTVVSYNIGYGKNIDRALLEVKEIESQKGLDIVLLQEMDELGTERIARDLRMNYVYYPAAVEPTYHKNFGNAILSRWPITDPQKLILPHKSYSNCMKRIATRATIKVRDADVLAYSIHTEPVFILPKYKENQYTAILKDIGTDARPTIVGGDFNSFTEADVGKIEKHYSQAGFVRASRESGHTFFRFGVWMPPDHIFVKGFEVEGSGQLAEATASDHLPIWVTLIFK